MSDRIARVATPRQHQSGPYVPADTVPPAVHTAVRLAIPTGVAKISSALSAHRRMVCDPAETAVVVNPVPVAAVAAEPQDWPFTPATTNPRGFSEHISSIVKLNNIGPPDCVIDISCNEPAAGASISRVKTASTVSTELSVSGRQFDTGLPPLSGSRPQLAAQTSVVNAMLSWPSSCSASWAVAVWTTRLLARRFMKAAICPRVTLSSGQNWVLAGGLQPRVTSASANHAMSRWKVFESDTSSKR